MKIPQLPDSASDFRPYLELAARACDGASEILNNHFGNLRNLDEKFQAGLVSDADRESENFIAALIRESFPTHSILGEETGLSSSQIATSSHASADSTGPLWMVDPLDGTTNFVHQFPLFCISIGLEIDGEMVMGMVHAPKMGLRFHAVRGGGAYLNNEPIHVSQRKTIHEGLFATGFSAIDDSITEQLELVSKIVRESRGVRRAGAAALDMCFVAQGVFDVFWEKNLSPWDTAAGTVIASEAGAIVTDMEGGKYNPRTKSILCGNPPLHKKTLEMMQAIRGRARA